MRSATLSSGSQVPQFAALGITQTATLPILGVCVNAAIAVVLGLHAWRPRPRTTGEA